MYSTVYHLCAIPSADMGCAHVQGAERGVPCTECTPSIYMITIHDRYADDLYHFSWTSVPTCRSFLGGRFVISLELPGTQDLPDTAFSLLGQTSYEGAYSLELIRLKKIIR